METLENTVRDLSVQISGLALGLSALYHLAQCLFGYRLRRLWIVCAGFFLGFAFGGIMGILFLPKNSRLLLFAVLIALAAGAVTALLAYKLYMAGMFLLSLAAVLPAVAALFPDNLGWAGLVAGLIAGILAGLLTLRFLRPFVILTTAIGGGLSAAQQALSLFGADVALPAVLGAGAILALIGAAVQFAMNPRERD